MAGFRKFYDADGSIMDEGIVLCFPNPHSFTGEDVVELQGHGGPVIQNALLGRLFELGAIAAKPANFPCVLLKMARWTWYKRKRLPT